MVRVGLSVKLKRHGVDCGRTVGRIGPGTRADRSRTRPHLGHNLDTGANPFNLGALVPPNLSVRSSQVRGCYLQLEREEEGRGLARAPRVLEVESKSVLSGYLDHSNA